MMQKDNPVIFINLDGTPLDKGAKDYQRANRLPTISCMKERVTNERDKILIVLPIKMNERTPIEREGIVNCMRSLVDVI